MIPLIVISATYIITHVLVYSDGPGMAFYDLRRKTNDIGLFDCFPCAAFWVALIACAITGAWAWLLPAWAASTIIDQVIHK